MDKKDRSFFIQLGIWVAIILYFILPPHNKIAQWGYVVNNVVHFFDVSTSDIEKSDYIFHRNNAIYLVKLDNEQGALREIDRAIASFPTNLPEEQLYKLYGDRADINLYYEKHHDALVDYLRIPDPNMNVLLKIALLYKEEGKRKTAVTWCNKILDKDIKAYAGYACLADVYADAGKYESAVTIMDLLIDRVPNRARYIADRAKYKKLAGDMDGYNEDLKKAREILPGIDPDISIIKTTLDPKSINFSIM